MTAIEGTPIVKAPHASRSLGLIAFLWASLLLFQSTAVHAILDWDMFHQMSLAREFLATGHIPLHDSFAYTPTVTPVIHHEWGMGLLLYLVATRAGLAGIYLLLLALVAGIAAGCIMLARLRGAAWPAIILCSALAATMGIVVNGAVRAPFFTSLFMAAQLLLLESDRKGKRAWIPVWFLIYVAWTNIHGGFLVGLGVLGLHWAEMALRTRSWQPHLLAVLLITMALSGVSPYGYAHVASVISATLMPRPLIPEWGPLWTDPLRMTAFVLSLLPLMYALRKIGWTRAVGLPLIVVCALMSISHLRHTGLYALAWLGYVPAWFTATPAGRWVAELWERRAALLRAVLGPLVLVSVLLGILNGRYCLVMPVYPDQAGGYDAVYPVGPVAYLRDQRFHGNVMTPYHMGAFLSWNLAPAVKVSLDSRYEAAYPPAMFPETVAFYQADPGWRDTLLRYPTDLVLVRNDTPVAAHLGAEAGWRQVYVDDVYSLYARPGITLPVVNRIGQPLLPSFP